MFRLAVFKRPNFQTAVIPYMNIGRLFLKPHWKSGRFLSSIRDIVDVHDFRASIGQAKSGNLKATSSKIAVCDFYAPWCAPCRVMNGILEKVQDSYKTAPETISFLKVDIDQYTDLAAEHNITMLPTVQLFKNGKCLVSIVGYQNIEQIQDVIEKHCPELPIEA